MTDHESFAPREPGDEPEAQRDAQADERDAQPDMTGAQPDEAIARLRAADPAADVEPTEAFPAVVAARAAEAKTTGNEVDTAPDPATPPPVDLASRRRRSWFTPAVAAAAAAVVGISGYAIGAGGVGPGGDSMADSAAPSAVEEAQRADGSSSEAAGPITLGTSPESAAGGQGPASPGMGMDSAGSSEESSADRSMAGSVSEDSMYGGPGRSTFRATGLSTAERSAQAYGLDAAGASTPERLAQLAQALGLAGTPEIIDGSWQLTEGAKQLYVGLDGTLSLNYYDSEAQPWCEGCEEPLPENAPSGDAAIESLKEVLTSIGEDPAQFEYSAPTYEGAVTATAQARRIIDGQATDLSFTIDLAPAGVASVWGSLAGVVDLGAYPVVSEQEGLERLSDSRFGGFRTSWPMPIDGVGDIGVMQEWTPPTEAPAAPEPGTVVDWPVQDVEIVSARLGLAQQWQPDNTVMLVPSYEFTDADGGTWSVIAVAEEMLDLSAE